MSKWGLRLTAAVSARLPKPPQLVTCLLVVAPKMLFERETRAFTSSPKGQNAVARMACIAQRMMFVPKKDALFEGLCMDFRHEVEAFRLCIEAVVL